MKSLARQGDRLQRSGSDDAAITAYLLGHKERIVDRSSLEIPSLRAALEPANALLGGVVREGIGDYVTARLLP